MFDLADAVLCADGPVRTLVGLSLAPEHRRGHGALYDAVNAGRVEADRLRDALARLPLPRTADGRIVLAVDVSAWLRPDANTSPEWLFCHVYGRGRSADQQIPGWQYSWVAALETGASSWTAPLDMVRLGRADDLAAVTATQLRAVADRLIAAGHHQPADPDILIVADAGYDPARLAYDLTGLPVQVLGRIRADRVLCRPVPPRAPGTTGRPPKHGPVFRLDTWTWLILVVYTQLRLARTLTGDLRRPWERPARPGRVSPARVRRGFRNLHPKTSHPAGAPKPSRPGPGRPPGTPNRHPAHRHDVGKTVLRAQTLKEQRKHAS